MRDMGLIDRLPRIAVGQAEQANPLYRSYRDNFNSFEPIQAGDTMASAIKIGDPVSRDRAIRTLRAFDGVVEQASESELVNACASGRPNRALYLSTYGRCPCRTIQAYLNVERLSLMIELLSYRRHTVLSSLILKCVTTRELWLSRGLKRRIRTNQLKSKRTTKRSEQLY